MTRIALISDIHSSEVALSAVLADIRRTGVDQIVCLGDVANLGPQPGAVIEILGELGCPCIMGNHDEFLIDPKLVHSYCDAAVIVDSVEWSRSKLSRAALDFVRGFEREREIALGGNARLYLFHGTPRSNMENLLATTPAETLDEMLLGRSATVMAGGHTHIQMLRRHHGNLVVNSGSVGMAFEDYFSGGVPTLLSVAEYAIVEERGGAIEVHLRRLPLDRDKLRAANGKSDHPLRDFFLQQYS